MPELGQLLKDRAAEASQPPGAGFADVQRRARNTRRRKASIVGAAGCAAAVAVAVVATSGQPGRSGLETEQPAGPGATPAVSLPPCPPAPAGVQPATKLGPYGSGLADAILRQLDGWQISPVSLFNRDLGGCAATPSQKAQMRQGQYPLADYDALTGATLELSSREGLTSVNISITTARYTPGITRDDALDIARGFVTQQADEWRRAIETNPSPAPGDPTSVTAHLEPEAEGDAPGGGHWWIFQGQQNDFGFAWTPDGSFTFAREDPDTNPAHPLGEFADALTAAAAYQATQ
jgi:hypothetical protein